MTWQKFLSKLAMLKINLKVVAAITHLEKRGCAPITLPKPAKGTHVDIVYIRLVREAVVEYLSDIGGEED